MNHTLLLVHITTPNTTLQGHATHHSATKPSTFKTSHHPIPYYHSTQNDISSITPYHIATPPHTTIHHTQHHTTHNTTPHKTTLRHTTSHPITPHHATPHHITPNHITLHHTTPHNATLPHRAFLKRVHGRPQRTIESLRESPRVHKRPHHSDDHKCFVMWFVYWCESWICETFPVKIKFTNFGL